MEQCFNNSTRNNWVILMAYKDSFKGKKRNSVCASKYFSVDKQQQQYL